jgi:RNA polymerase sigma factor (sigma-70 family)
MAGDIVTRAADGVDAAPTGRADESDYDEFARLYPRLRRLAAVVRPPHVDPDDLVQDALVRVLAGGGLARLARPDAYLSRTIVSIAADRRRSWSSQRRAIVRLAGGDAPSSDDYTSDLADLLALPPGDRAAVFLRYVEGLDYAYIAEVLDLKEATVRKRASRGRHRLTRIIAEDTGRER